MKVNVKKQLEIFYMFVLLITLGAVLTSGIFVASTIFNSSSVFGLKLLSHYQEGLLMTEIFLKLNYLIHFCIFLILLFELYRFKSFDRDNVLLVAMIIAVFSGLLFTQYYTPDILAMQTQGAEATQSAAFEAVHKGSEFAFKLFAVALGILAYKNVLRLGK